MAIPYGSAIRSLLCQQHLKPAAGLGQPSNRNILFVECDREPGLWTADAIWNCAQKADDGLVRAASAAGDVGLCRSPSIEHQITGVDLCCPADWGFAALYVPCRRAVNPEPSICHKL